MIHDDNVNLTTNTEVSQDNSSLHSNTESQVCSSSRIKLPPFWTNSPEIWFHQAEAQFSIAKIRSDRTKYDYVVAILPLEVISNIFDVIQNPPNNNLYNNLKEKIIQRLTASEEQRLDRLLSESEIDDRKPSEFFREMSVIVGSSSIVSPELLLKLWKRRLPKTILVAITATDKVQINEILELADKIWEAYRDNNIAVLNSSVVSSLPGASQNNDSNSLFPSQILNNFNDLSSKCIQTMDTITNNNKKIDEKINALQTQVDAMQQNNYRSPLQRQDINYRFKSNSRDRNQNNLHKIKICFYHNKYKNDAFKCEGPWCQFLAMNQSKNNKLN